MPGKEGKITMNFILEQLEENELDLSMNSMDTVPLRELAKVRKGTALDLSRNILQLLPDNFGILNHLISLDLSSNQLQSLPESFGKLNSLQKLDLYSNQLTSLPLSFWHLKKLRWLDLKKNPLEADLKEAAGRCVSLQDCTQCANQVLVYVKARSSQAERDHQNELRKQREQESRRKEEEARRLAALKRERTAQHLRKQEQDMQQVDNGSLFLTPSPSLRVDPAAGTSHPASGGGEGVCWTCVQRLRCVSMWLLLPLLLLLLLPVTGLVVCPLLMEPSTCPVVHAEDILHRLDELLHMLGLGHIFH